MLLLAVEDEVASWLVRLVIFWTLTERWVVAFGVAVVVFVVVFPDCSSESVLDSPGCGLLMDAMTR